MVVGVVVVVSWWRSGVVLVFWWLWSWWLWLFVCLWLVGGARYTIYYSFVNRKNNLGRTCVHTCFNPSSTEISDGHEECLHVLLDLAGAFAHLTDKKGLSAEALVSEWVSA